ncbi:hypothetical protein BH11MYX1_BH11MYX1_10480 [soil metagenome]
MSDLEAAVRATWDREAIEVYADHLQSTGDPRGELVAIDLRIDDVGATAELVARRAELIEAWFGAGFGAAVPPGIVRYGFVDADATGMGPDSQLASVLRGPGAKFVRSVALAGTTEQNRVALEQLAAEERPWLTKLVIRQWQETIALTLGNEETKKLFARTPALAALELEGRRILGNVAHPNVRAIKITGYDALASLADATRIWPRLEAIDFAFHCQFASQHTDPPIELISRLFAGPTIPALTALDLSRNEPGHLEPRSLGGDVVMPAFAMRFANHPRLAVLTLPSLRFETAVVTIERMLASLPALRDVTVWGPSHRLPTSKAPVRQIVPDRAEPGPKRLG